MERGNEEREQVKERGFRRTYAGDENPVSGQGGLEQQDIMFEEFPI